MTSNNKSIALAIFCLYLTSAALGRSAPSVRWGHQLITATDDVPRAAAADGHDGIYFAVKRESKDDSGSATSKSMFLLKYSQQGDHLWSKQLDTGVEDVTGLTADDQGNIFVFGHADSTLERQTKGGYDAFIARYDQAGAQQWLWQPGTPEHDVCTGLDFDGDENMYISGYTYGDFAKPNQGGADMFIAAYDKHRTLLWRDQIGTAADDRAVDIRVGDSNDVYLCGNTSGNLARQNNGQGDFVVARYERTGKRLWLQQYGTNDYESIMCMEVGELGHLYLGCRTDGSFGYRRSRRMDLDSCLVSTTTTGKMLWVRQFGTAGWDGTWDMARFTDGSGDIMIAGCQIPVKNKCQAYCRRYSSQGELIWTKEFRMYSSRGGTCGRVCTIDSTNNCYYAGYTNGNQFGVNNGTSNVFIVRFDEAKDEQVKP